MSDRYHEFDTIISGNIYGMIQMCQQGIPAVGAFSEDLILPGPQPADVKKRQFGKRVKVAMTKEGFDTNGSGPVPKGSIFKTGAIYTSQSR